jgi:peptidoglycan hydrolase-like protein with peptidoglycan-binding domain
MFNQIRRSVGAGGVNNPQDVGIVQHLLNLSHALRGVPTERLQVNGIAGPETLAAISEFQSKFCTAVDGRIDPHRETIMQLNRKAGPSLSLNTGEEYLQVNLNRTRIT